MILPPFFVLKPYQTGRVRQHTGISLFAGLLERLCAVTDLPQEPERVRDGRRLDADELADASSARMAKAAGQRYGRRLGIESLGISKMY
jgi:hypothetical protein